ncbi:hypothetical protein Tco_0816959 [Tanacetum coccineum]
MVFNSPCFTVKSWLVQDQTVPELAIPKQTATGKGLSNPLMAVTKDAVMLRVFPFTLAGAAKRWVDRLAPGTIDTLWMITPKSGTTEHQAGVLEAAVTMMRHEEAEGKCSCNPGPPGYYTKTYNCPPYGERKPSLEELLNKHQEESARRSTKMKEWIKKL